MASVTEEAVFNARLTRDEATALYALFHFGTDSDSLDRLGLGDFLEALHDSGVRAGVWTFKTQAVSG